MSEYHPSDSDTGATLSYMAMNNRGGSRPTAIVKKAFEAWDPSLGMVVIMNAGTVLRILQIVFDQRFDRERPPVKRAVEVEVGGHRYFAEFERLRENATVADLPEAEAGR